MGWLVDLFVGPGMAGVTGLLGGLVAKFYDLKAKKQEQAHDEAMRLLDLEESKLERDHALLLVKAKAEHTQLEGNISLAELREQHSTLIEQGELKAFEKSQQAGNTVTGALKFVRPGITAYLLLAVTVLFYGVWSQVGGLTAFSETQLVSLLTDLVNAAIYLTVLCIGWWFGSRGGNLVSRLNLVN